MIRVLKAHWFLTMFVIVVWTLFCAFWVIENWAVWEGPLDVFLFTTMALFVFSSQAFWIGYVGALGKTFVSRKSWRKLFGSISVLAYILVLALNVFSNADKGSAFTVRAALLEVPFSIWFVGSVLGFVLVVVLCVL